MAYSELTIEKKKVIDGLRLEYKSNVIKELPNFLYIELGKLVKKYGQNEVVKLITL